MFCESLNIDIFVKPRRRANFEAYDTALDGHCATRAFAVYAAPVLPVVVEFGFRVRGVRVSQLRGDSRVKPRDLNTITPRYCQHRVELTLGCNLSGWSTAKVVRTEEL